MAQETTAQSTGKKARPIVPYLRLGDGQEAPYLAGEQCAACGAVYLDHRVACSKCTATGPFKEIRLSKRGTLYVYAIVYQSMPGIKTPYVAAIVDLPEGVSVRATLIDVEPDPRKIAFDLPVEMVSQKVKEDKDGTDVIAYFFRPVR